MKILPQYITHLSEIQFILNFIYESKTGTSHSFNVLRIFCTCLTLHCCNVNQHKDTNLHMNEPNSLCMVLNTLSTIHWSESLKHSIYKCFLTNKITELRREKLLSYQEATFLYDRYILLSFECHPPPGNNRFIFAMPIIAKVLCEP